MQSGFIQEQYKSCTKTISRDYFYRIFDGIAKYKPFGILIMLKSYKMLDTIYSIIYHPIIEILLGYKVHGKSFVCYL